MQDELKNVPSPFCGANTLYFTPIHKFCLTILVLPLEITTQADFEACFVAGRP